MGSRLVLDGGLATELEQRGYDLSIGKLWSARLLRTNPLAIRDIHLRYLDAGADIITSATYQATVEGYMAEFQMERNEAECELIAGAKLAVDVRDEFCKSTKRHAKVAGSIGPYGGSLGDGSEYRGNYGVSRETLREFHEKQIKCMVNSGVDILAFETVPDQNEALEIASLMQTRFSSTSFWISFQCRPRTEWAQSDIPVLASGFPLYEICHQLFHMQINGMKNLWGLGVNCVEPQSVEKYTLAVSRARESVQQDASNLEKESLQNVHILSYPNSGEVYDPIEKTWSWPEDEYFGQDSLSKLNSNHERACVSKWSSLQLSSTASVLGGCCRTGPFHTQKLSELVRLTEINSELV